MKNLCLFISMLVLLIPAEIKAQEKKESIVTIEMYSISGSSTVGYHAARKLPFVIQTIDGQNNVEEKTFNPSRNNPINNVLEFKKELDFWTNNGYRLFSIETSASGGSSHFYFFAILVKDEE
jgi:hypothetical protein